VSCRAAKYCQIRGFRFGLVGPAAGEHDDRGPHGALEHDARAQHWCYIHCCTVPTSYPRIAITRDPELDAAITRAASLVGANVPAARLVRDLALRGARALEADDAARRTRRRAFAGRIASESPPWDRAVLERVEDLSA